MDITAQTLTLGEGKGDVDRNSTSSVYFLQSSLKSRQITFQTSMNLGQYLHEVGMPGQLLTTSGSPTSTLNEAYWCIQKQLMSLGKVGILIFTVIIIPSGVHM